MIGDCARAMTDEPPAGCGLGESQDATSGPDYDLDDLRAENQRLRAGLEQMQGDVLRLSRALEPMHRSNEELAQLRGETDQLRTEAEQLRTEAEQLRTEAEQLRAAGQAYRERIEQLAGQLQAVYDSSSWRLTRPIRWLKRCFS
jgi:uncharacterized coiled-coil DUF342 family protein